MNRFQRSMGIDGDSFVAGRHEVAYHALMAARQASACAAIAKRDWRTAEE
jgi:hypothetical protein